MQKLNILFLLGVLIAVSMAQSFRASPPPGVFNTNSQVLSHQHVTVAIRHLDKSHPLRHMNKNLLQMRVKQAPAQESEDQDVNLYAEEQKQWERQQEEQRKQAAIEKQLEDEKAKIEREEESKVIDQSADINDDLDQDLDINQPNAYQEVRAENSVVEEMVAASVDDLKSADSGEVESKTFNEMPIETQTLKSTEQAQSLGSVNLDEVALYKELLGTYEPKKTVEDPSQLNGDLKYTADEQVTQLTTEEQAKELFEEYERAEVKHEQEEAKEQLVASIVESVPTTQMAPSISPKEQYAEPVHDAETILPFSHPEFAPDAYVYPDSVVPEVPHNQAIDVEYNPEATGQKPPVMVVESIPVENKEEADDASPVLMMLIQKNLHQLVEDDEMFNAGPSQFKN